MSQPRCESHDKVLYTSKKQGLKTLVGDLAGKRMRFYPCEDHPGLGHMTKEPVKVRNSERNRRPIKHMR